MERKQDQSQKMAQSENSNKNKNVTSNYEIDKESSQTSIVS
jgi:hypothetical protein